jgi:rod shape-determining protein MreD
VSDGGKLGLRLGAFGFVMALVQITGVSQIPILGVNADLAPLVVASVGLLAGSVPGALMGFGFGLFTDLALAQTLGVTPLLLVPVGYAAGRLRELRDPSHALVPLAVGAFASLAFAAGFSVIQLMLGVDAPVSILVIRDILAVTLVGAILALPVHALAARAAGRGSGRAGARTRRRRAYATGGLSPLTTSGRR